MAFWSSETLKDRIPADQLIVPYDPEHVKHCAYEMGVGGEAFVTSKPTDGPRLSAGSQVEIPPGQFGLLITAEIVTVPPDAIGFISIRAGIKFRGLVNVSGFHVDPGFKGQLKFAVYNAGSQTIRLDQGQRVFLIWLCDLDDPTGDVYRSRPSTPNVITADDVSRIAGDVASPAELRKRIDELKADSDKRFYELRTELEKKIHAAEQSKLFNRALILVLISLLAGIFLRPYFEAGPSSKNSGSEPSKGNPVEVRESTEKKAASPRKEDKSFN
jgi:dCTP deaminase